MGIRETPARARILGALAETNRRLRPLFAVWPALTIAALAAVDWAALATRLPFAAIAVLISGAPLYTAAFWATFRKIRWVEDIAPDRRLGHYTRQDLARIVADVHRRLGIRRATPAAITPDKDLNASAMNLGLGGLFPKLDAIYIHRPVLHVLDPGELASVVGHELAHYHRYKVDFYRATPLHLLLLASVALALISRVAEPWLAFGAIACVTWAHNTLLGSFDAPHRRPIEYLCDEAGAEAAGVIPAINCELKMGLEAEASLRLQDELLRAGKDLPVARLMALYEDAIPFGGVDHDELRRRIEAGLKQERQSRRGLSLRGFVDYLREGEGDAEAREAVGSLVPQGRALAWDRDALRRQGSLDEAQIAALVAALEADPDALLFHLPGEALDPRAFTHPPNSRRVLYLWRNRAAIEASAKALAHAVSSDGPR